MKNIKKILCFLLLLLMIPLTGCDFSIDGKHKLSIKDLNNIILNIDEICESNQTYGLYREGDEITFEIKFFSGLSATLLVDGTVYRPTAVEAWEPEYIKYTMPDHDVNVVSLINGYDGENIVPTGQFKLTIIDEHDYIYDKPEQQYFTPFTEIKLHSYPIMDADLCMYVDGELYSKQTSIETDEGYIWEYSFIMPIGETILEFSTDPFSPHTYYSFADIFNWVSLLNETTLKAIEIEDGYIGVDPNNPNNAPIIRYSEKIEDINYNLQVLENEPLVKMHNYEPVDGGWYRKVKYITFEGQEYILKISNGKVLWNNFSSYEYFRFDRTPCNIPDIITER